MARLIALLGMLMTLGTPLMAANSASPNRQEQFGDLIIHYNAFASGLLQPAIAQEAGLIRSKGQGVINITAVKNGKTVPATVSGTIQDLTGREKPLTFKPFNENSAVNYLAQFAVEPDSSATYVFTINVKTGDDDTHTLSFNQQIFSDE
ncbi:DUF4426 domain-containing protein [Pseudomonas sp. SLFW]|uniref:DUF4426 domain-containing protein n=1 Tax=Pseudomonas sp. SLFW TaxID=2683259 RepID=UPI0014122428|nr:DUF4426 domain-containing protein [Pseudomonas sp. SLFW]NBB10605.1 DUF4426 domain-containing protein [Pseudomonas sp. SLFW]